MHCSTAVQNNALWEEINLSWLYGNWDVISIVFVGRGMKLLVTAIKFAFCHLCPFVMD